MAGKFLAGKVQVAKREHLQRACESIIDGGPRCVDSDAIAAFKSAALGYAHTQYGDPMRVLEDIYASESETGHLVRKAAEIITKRLDNMEVSPATGALYSRTRSFLEILDEDDDDDRDDDDDDEKDDLMMDNIDKAHRDRGAGPHGLTGALLEHLHDRLERRRERHGYTKAAKEQPMDTLHSIMKDGGIAGVCAAVVSKGSTTISEHELVEAVSKVAAERYPELSSAQAFAKIYSDGGAEGRVLRQAINVAKLSVFDLAPVYVGGVDATHEAIDATEQSEAYAQLEAMASKLRASSPWLSSEQAFAKVFEDPKNGKLAAKAHRRPSPTTSYEFPR